MKYVLSKRDSQTDMTSLKGIFIILLTVNVLAPASNKNLTLDCEDKVAECLSVIPPCDNQELQQCPKLCGICYSTPLMNTDNNSTCTDDPECTNYSLPFDCNSTTSTWPSEHCLMSCNLCQDHNLSDTTITPRDEESTSVGKSSRIKETCTDNPGCKIYTFPGDCNSTILTWPSEHCLVSCNLCSQQMSTTVHSIIDNKSSPSTVKTSKGTTTATRITTTVRRRSVTSPYQTTTPPRTESDKSSSKTSSYNEVDDLELTARIREEADSVEYTRPSPPTAHAHSTRTALSSHAERLIAVPPEAVTIEQAARAQQPEYVEIENEVRPNGDDGYLVPAGQYASLNPATRSEEGHEYENLGSRPTESSSTPGYSGLVKSTKREKHLYDRLRRETNQTIEAEEEDPTYAIALEQMPGPTFTKL